MTWRTHEEAGALHCPMKVGAPEMVGMPGVLGQFPLHFCQGELCAVWRKHPNGPEGYCGLAGEPK